MCGDTGVVDGEPLAAGSKAADLVDGLPPADSPSWKCPPVSAFGQDGYHVVVEMPEGCQFGVKGPRISGSTQVM